MPRSDPNISLPVDAVLPAVRKALASDGVGVLVAEPGAGKTTRVPLALIDEGWRNNRKIIVLEPRRIAARAAAERLAENIGETLGDTIGLRARLSSKTSARAAIEVVTEGVFTRMILDDPELSQVAAVIFDEFHERSLDADLGLALALDARGALRPDLRLLVMSATLEASRVASLLGSAPVITSAGRAFPIVTRYLSRRHPRVEDDVTDAILKAIAAETGSILAFLPGQGEISRVAERLVEHVRDPAIEIAPLYGALDARAQDLAIAPPPAGKRKIVLATAVAETSITIEGVRVVIDSGLMRVPRYEADVAVTRLETVRVSRASADQRRGRAGRTEPGVCYRLWDEPETQGLVAFSEPEIRSADLAGLLLDCAEWGASDPRALQWLDPPNEGPLAAARRTLQAIGALDASGRITKDGERLRALPLPPRLARMICAAAEIGKAEAAAEIAAVIVERGMGGNDTDLDVRIERFRADRARRAADMRGMAARWARAAKVDHPRVTNNRETTAAILALAYPERVAKARGARGSFLLANGRAAVADPRSSLADAPFIVIAEMHGKAAATRVLLAARTNEADVLAFSGSSVEQVEDLYFDKSARAVRVRSVKRLGAIELQSVQRALAPGEDTGAVLARGISEIGVDVLPWTKTQIQLRHRVAFLAQSDAEWPDLSDEALGRSTSVWLQPFLAGISRVADINADILGEALDALLPWSLKRRLEAEAPTHFAAPTGAHHAVDYDGAGAPALHIRVQELYGLKEHPSIARGRLPLTLYLLSPAHRTIQITRDLPGFWSGSWSAVKADMRSQYPKHLWPDAPADAEPTTRAKPRSR